MSSGPAATAALGSASAAFEAAASSELFGAASFDECPGGFPPSVFPPPVFPPLLPGGAFGVSAAGGVEDEPGTPGCPSEPAGAACVSGVLPSSAPLAPPCWSLAPGAAAPGNSPLLRMIGRPSLPLPMTTILEFGDLASSSVASMPRQ